MKIASLETELIRRFIERYRSNLIVVVVTSIVINLLVLGGSVYMLLVYDSVLVSGSMPTLTGLFTLVALIYLFQAIFDSVRADALLNVANGVHHDLFQPVHRAAVKRSLQTGTTSESLQLTRDLDQVHTFLAGNGPIAIIDLPWVVLFLLVLFALHWWLGLAALAGTLVLAAITLTTSRRSALGTHRVMEVTGRRIAATQAEFRYAESARAMGMQRRLLVRSAACDEEYLEAQSFLSRSIARLGGAGRVFRLFLQSAILTVGALLVLDNRASGGIIIASSVLAGRALAPVDQAIANWRGLSAAREGWSRVTQALIDYRSGPPREVALTAPKGDLMVEDLWVAPPGAVGFVVQGVSFSLQAGDALAVIGPSAAGKTTLARAILGILVPGRGEIRIDGATHDQWEAEVIGASMGYVPQVVELMEGTLGENIARFDPAAQSEAIIAAAKAAGLHETILGFTDGYETRVTAGGPEFSAGQRQRIGLARALYGDPFLVVLDEPNSNLDAAGDAALSEAILGVRARGGIVVMVTHRPATLGPVSHIAVLAGGRLTDFGERDAVLQRMQGGGGAGEAANPAQANPAAAKPVVQQAPGNQGSPGPGGIKLEGAGT